MKISVLPKEDEVAIDWMKDHLKSRHPNITDEEAAKKHLIYEFARNRILDGVIAVSCSLCKVEYTFHT